MELTRIKEHVADRRGFLVDFEWVARKDNSFGNYPCGIRVHKSPHRHELWSCGFSEEHLIEETKHDCTLRILGFSEKNTGLLSVHHRTVGCGYICRTMAKISFEFVDIIGTLASPRRLLAIDWVD